MGREASTLRVALVVPLQGPAGIFGPSCEAVAATALTLINQTGVLGRDMSVEVVDGGAPPAQIAAEIGRLIDAGGIDGVTGWHISAVRQTLAPITAGRIPYVYTSLYEGGETRPGVFCSGETPARQVAPALRWLRDVRDVRRWFIIGDDYVWPRASVDVTRLFARRLDLRVAGTAFVPLGTRDFAQVLERIRGSDAQGVLMYLVGQDAVEFNRAFTQWGLQDDLVRFTPLMEENMLMASGADATEDLFVCASYFRSLATASALDLGADYVAQHGPDAPPLNNAAESCYEGLMTLAALAQHAGSVDVRRMLEVADGVGYDGPRGAVSFVGNHLQQPVHLAVADGVDFDVLTDL
ncbi:substrate-binding domain-containing protein [Blastococcus tunisiensis]|uniref:ABC-type branched-chain amino acid transport system, substrate-binding protein n=1 Tax=Blastococcus tunisiensis TaxID=1798228 RepID=A0A1I2DMN2_9ACTN|nr:substrate-binding domain-containing protein [Blastococcus sp. DSM 46838]SFE81533.1 ABC-type branched-chain amino acid transport system, substrate-binding protein [Blastococcus sp. DSM 46838]